MTAGRRHLEEALGSKITVTTYPNVRSASEAERVMEEAVEAGADVIFATAPPLIGASRKVVGPSSQCQGAGLLPGYVLCRPADLLQPDL